MGGILPNWWPFGRKHPTLVDPPAPIALPEVQVPDPTPEPLPAGVEWCKRFPGSNRLEDLAEPFRTNAQKFVAHLIGLGYRPRITSTRRPEQRAWLMLQTWCVVRERLPLDQVPVREDIPVQPWTLAGALAMFREYGLVHRPSLTSRHIQGLAVDLEVPEWMGSDEALWALAEEFGVHHLPGDPVHYSVDGH